jgi:hypothetical protein
MGHESQIELWLTPNDHVLLADFRIDWLRCEEAMEKPLTRKIQTAEPQRSATESMARKARTIPAQSDGLEARKTPAVGEVFFLDFPFYRTNQMR